MKTKYKIDHWGTNSCAYFIVDSNKFTEKMAKETLEFFLWDYDKEVDPIDEVVKKYGIEAIMIATNKDYNTKGVIGEFVDKEGFYPVDGSSGIKLMLVEMISIESDDLTLTKKSIK